MDEISEAQPSKVRLFVKDGLKFLLKISISVAIVGYLIWKYPDSISRTYSALKIEWLIPAAVCYGLHIVANAWRWWILLRAQQIQCSLFNAVSLTFQSFFFSLVMPGGALGGDLVRGWFIATRMTGGRKFDGVFTILMDRFTGMLGMFLVAVGMLPFSWWCIAGGGGILRFFIFVLLAGSVIGLTASVFLFKHRMFETFRWFSFLSGIADRMTHGFYTKVSSALDSYQTCKKELLICVFASMVLVNLNLALVMYLIARGIVGDVVPFSAVLAAMTVGNIAGLIPATPSGIGARDLFVVAILAAAGLSDDQALGISLTMTAMIMAFNLFGGLFFIFGKAAAIQAVTLPQEGHPQ